MGTNYKPGKKPELWIKNIQRTMITMGRYIKQVADVHANNTCALVCVDQYLIKTGAVCTKNEAHTIKMMNFSVSHVV